MEIYMIHPLEHDRAVGVISACLCMILLYFAGATPVGFVCAYLFPCLLACKTCKGVRRRLRPPGVRSFAFGFSLVLTLLFLTAFVVGLFPFADESEKGRISLVGVLLAPLFEELLWRGVLADLLEPLGVLRFSVISSVCFALLHSSPGQIWYAFVAGMIFSLALEFTDSLLPSMAAHLANNLLAALSAAASARVYFAVFFISAAFALLVLLYFALFDRKTVKTLAAGFGAKHMFAAGIDPAVCLLFAALICTAILPRLGL